MPVEIPSSKHVLIAGPTASGKSGLAMRIALEQGGLIVNADALQVYDGWRILTARPTIGDERETPHSLYGHIAFDQPYSVGNWLREVAPLLDQQRLIIVGGTGLYFSALTEGLARIPQTPHSIRQSGDSLSITDLLAEIDPDTRAEIDVSNRARVQRAWEVQKTTGRSILDWQSETDPAIISSTDMTPLVLDAPKDWLNPRIEKRFDLMLDAGAIEEARDMLPDWNPHSQSSKAIGAAELIAHLNGEVTLEYARERSIIATRQYAKRQRTWFKKRMNKWIHLDMSSTDLSTAFAL